MTAENTTQERQAPIRFGTSELPLATKLYREDGEMLDGVEVVRIRGRWVTKWYFLIPDSGVIDDYRRGTDGITQYETCRKMLLRMGDDEVRTKEESDDVSQG